MKQLMRGCHYQNHTRKEVNSMLDVDKLGSRKNDFLDYINGYCKKHGISEPDAMEHKIVQIVYEEYLEDGKCAVED